jgi:hypothetical protein
MAGGLISKRLASSLTDMPNFFNTQKQKRSSWPHPGETPALGLSKRTGSCVRYRTDSSGCQGRK